MPGGTNFWPWGYGVTKKPKDPTMVPVSTPAGGLSIPFLNSGEFNLVDTVTSTVSKATSEASRLFTSSNMGAVKQATPLETGPAWYNIPGRIAGAASGINDAFQSTLIKVIVLVAVVGVVGVFGMSYMQAKGANLAK